jgi:acetyl-CoA carboxylase biotin carboxyl carrier protein
MSSSNLPGQGEVFDVRRIRRLVELMKEHDLSEIDLREGQTRIRLRRGPDDVITMAPQRVAVTPSPAPAATKPATEGASAAAAEEKLAIIKSPMVGTFYTSPNPESPAFVKVGDHVGAETVVCIIEAMKVFNEIPAEISGKIVARLVDNGEPVEFGQPLYKVDVGK